MLKITKDKEPSHTVLFVEGELDMSTCSILIDALSEADDGVTDVAFDFAALKFIDSTGVGHLLFECKKIQEQGRSVSFLNLNEEISLVFDVLGVPYILGEEAFTQG